MKKILLAAATTLAVTTACQKNEVAVFPTQECELYATIEDNTTKTYLDGDNNIRWCEGDQVVAFMKSSEGSRYQIKDEYIGKTSGYFSPVSSDSSSDLGADNKWDHNIVYYPYSGAIEAEKSGLNYNLDVVLPSEQAYASGSFGNGSMAMVAVSGDNNITFRNVLSGMKLQLCGTQKVKSIKLQGKDSEKLSGAATVTAYTDGKTKPVITMASDASTSLTLDCSDGVKLNESNPTEFIIALPPVLFSNGFTVTVTDTDGQTYTVETDKPNRVSRSSLLVMPEVTLENPVLDDRWVDLGLSVLWAAYNVGADSPEQYGGYYAWGETEEKDYYTWGSYDYKELFNYGSVPGSFYSGVFIGEEISKTTYDVAYIYSEDSARMPTLAEFQELIDNCSIEPGTYNDINGNYVTGPNGNRIFLPFAGYKADDKHYSEGSIGCFWTGTYYKKDDDKAYCITSRKDYTFSDTSMRYLGRSVRPVKDRYLD